MSVNDPSNVVAPGGFTIPADVSLTPVTIPLYTLTGIYNERIESFFMTLVFDNDDANVAVMVLQLTAANGDVLYQQNSPVIKPPGNPANTVYCTWSRLGNDDPNDTLVFTPFGSDGHNYAWFNVRLPDLVLAPLASVQLIAYRSDDDETADLVVTDAALTTTRNAGPASDTSLVDILPLLVPTSTG